MENGYLPESDFLISVMNEEVPFGERDLNEKNLKRLIAMTRDELVANRDWATMLLSHLELDRDDVKQALIAAASDEDEIVRAEALSGLSMLDKSLALPLIKKELQGQFVSMPLLEAAENVADPSLIGDLKAFAEPSDDAFIDRLVTAALMACEAKLPSYPKT